MNEVPFFIATILAKLLSGKYIFSTILTPVRKNTHTYEYIPISMSIISHTSENKPFSE